MRAKFLPPRLLLFPHPHRGCPPLFLFRHLSASTCSLAAKDIPLILPSLATYPTEKIRNFGIVAHVDHGKSTLADRLLAATGVIGREASEQYLDKLQVERERGITVKAQTCTMFHKGHMLNLIDTPGHVDFSFEVARSLAACDGILLLVAANQGIQAQTIANFWLAFERDLPMVPLINKIDLAGLREGAIERVEAQLGKLFDFHPSDIIRISAKTGENIEAVLDAIVGRLPAPASLSTTTPNPSILPSLQTLTFDSWFDHYKGAVSLVRVQSGAVAKGQRVRSRLSGREYEVTEVGFMHPEMVAVEALLPGQVGYLACGMRSAKEAIVGDTLHDPVLVENEVCTFANFRRAKPTVYACLYPLEVDGYEEVSKALDQLCLNDSSVELRPERSDVMGQGWRCGFLGVLHMEVFCQRLEQEHPNADFLLTAPTVEYKADVVANESIRSRRYNGRAQVTLSAPSQYPQHPPDIACFQEPMVRVTMLVPKHSHGNVTQLCEAARGVEADSETELDDERLVIKWRLPLAEVVSNFFDELKRLTSGYVSFDYEDDGYQPADLVKVGVLVNGKLINELSLLCLRQDANRRAKELVERLKTEIPRQQYEVNIKVVLGDSKKAVAQANIRPYAKNFMSKIKGNTSCGGTQRLQKLLNNQAKAKERLKLVGNLRIPKEVFINVMRRL